MSDQLAQGSGPRIAVTAESPHLYGATFPVFHADTDPDGVGLLMMSEGCDSAQVLAALRHSIERSSGDVSSRLATAFEAGEQASRAALASWEATPHLTDFYNYQALGFALVAATRSDQLWITWVGCCRATLVRSQRVAVATRLHNCLEDHDPPLPEKLAHSVTRSLAHRGQGPETVGPIVLLPGDVLVLTGSELSRAVAQEAIAGQVHGSDLGAIGRRLVDLGRGPDGHLSAWTLVARVGG